jgi:hypothetical protein
MGMARIVMARFYRAAEGHPERLCAASATA